MLNSAKQRYWHARDTLRGWRDVAFSTNGAFRSVVLASHLRPAGTLVPVADETARRADAALRWLVNAQDASPDDGASYGYFPLSKVRGWEASYPETTGYIMTSLVRYARR